MRRPRPRRPGRGWTGLPPLPPRPPRQLPPLRPRRSQGFGHLRRLQPRLGVRGHGGHERADQGVARGHQGGGLVLRSGGLGGESWGAGQRGGGAGRGPGPLAPPRPAWCLGSMRPPPSAQWMEWHPQAHVLLAGTADGNSWMWKIPGGDCKTFQGPSCPATCGKVLPDGAGCPALPPVRRGRGRASGHRRCSLGVRRGGCPWACGGGSWG